MIALIVLSSIALYICGAAATHGYTQYRFPDGPDTVYSTFQGTWVKRSNADARGFSTVFWPIALLMFGLVAISRFTFSSVSIRAQKKIEQNKTKLADLQQVRVELQKTEQELQVAEVEVEQTLQRIK